MQPRTVARIGARSPFASGPFTVRACLPVPAGLDLSASTTDFDLIDELTGEVLPAQVEPVAWRENGEPQVIELLARSSDAGGVGVVRYFQVEQRNRPRREPGLARPASDLAELFESDSIGRLVLRRCDGKEFSAELELTKAEHNHRRGHVITEPHLHVTLRAADGERALGAHVWAQAIDGESYLGLTLLLHTGFANDPVPDLYFTELELETLEGVQLVSAWHQPMMGAPVEADDPTRTRWPLVRELGSMSAHLWPQRQPLVLRLALCPAGGEARALELVRGAGFGSARNGDGWSYTDPSCGGVYAQAFPADGVTHLGNLETRARGLRDAYLAAMASGQQLGNGVTVNAARGPWTTHGVDYGGMTGGYEIEAGEGLTLLQGGEYAELTYYLARQSCLASRMRIALFEDDGRPIRLEDYASPNGTLPFVIFSGRIDPAKDHRFGFHLAKGPRPAVLPWYDASYRAVYNIDAQHGVRFTGTQKALAFGANDPVARMLLRLAVENWRGEWWDGPGGGLRGAAAAAAAKPGRGLGYGRGQGWIADAVASLCALSRNAQSRLSNWLVLVAQALGDGVMPNGFWQRTSSGKATTQAPFNGQHATAQMIELGIGFNAARAVLSRLSPSKTFDDLSAAMSQAARGLCRPDVWPANKSAPYSFVAVAPIDTAADPYALVPLGTGADNWQVGCVLGFAWSMFPHLRAELWTRIVALSGSSMNPLQALRARGFTAHGDRWALISALERP